MYHCGPQQMWVPGIFPGRWGEVTDALLWPLYHLDVPTVSISGSLRLLETSGLVTGLYWDSSALAKTTECSCVNFTEYNRELTYSNWRHTTMVSLSVPWFVRPATMFDTWHLANRKLMTVSAQMPWFYLIFNKNTSTKVVRVATLKPHTGLIQLVVRGQHPAREAKY